MKHKSLKYDYNSLSDPRSRADLIFERVEQFIQNDENEKALASLESLVKLTDFERLDALRLLARLYNKQNQVEKIPLLWLQAADSAEQNLRPEEGIKFLKEAFNSKLVEELGPEKTNPLLPYAKSIINRLGNQLHSYALEPAYLQPNSITFLIHDKISESYRRTIKALASNQDIKVSFLSLICQEDYEKQFINSDFEILYPEANLSLQERVKFVLQNIESDTLISEAVLSCIESLIIPAACKNIKKIAFNLNDQEILSNYENILSAESNFLRAPGRATLFQPLLKDRNPEYSDSSISKKQSSTILLALTKKSQVSKWKNLITELYDKLPDCGFIICSETMVLDSLEKQIELDKNRTELFACDSDEQYPLRNCKAAIFGYEISENILADSLAAGTPCFSSKSESESRFSSIYSEACKHFSFESLPDLFKDLLKLTNDADIYDKLSLLALSQSSRYSFHNAEKIILSLIENHKLTKPLEPIVKHVQTLTEEDDVLDKVPVIENSSATEAIDSFVPPRIVKKPVARIDNDKNASRLKIIKELILGNSHQKALELLDNSLKQNPDMPQLLLLNAECHIALNNKIAALSSIEKVLNIFPSHKKALELKTSAEAENAEPSEASQTDSTTDNKLAIEQEITRSIELLKSGDPMEALDKLLSIKSESEFIDYHHALALCYLKLQQIEKSSFHLEQELSAFPENHRAKELQSSILAIKE